MRTRSLDKNHDWTFGAGVSNYLKDNQAISQNIKCRLLSFIGDCFYNLSHGVEWYSVLGEMSEQELLTTVAAQILETKGVTKINQLNFILDASRNFTLVYSVDTIFGSLNDIQIEVNNA